MAITFDKAFGSHPDAMIARSKRAEMIAGNIANADTPGYRARDLTAFSETFAQSGQMRDIRATHTQPAAGENRLGLSRLQGGVSIGAWRQRQGRMRRNTGHRAPVPS